MLHILYCNYYVVINRNGGYNAGIYCGYYSFIYIVSLVGYGNVVMYQPEKESG